MWGSWNGIVIRSVDDEDLHGFRNDRRVSSTVHPKSQLSGTVHYQGWTY
jgi:hypothetical protein